MKFLQKIKIIFKPLYYFIPYPILSKIVSFRKRKNKLKIDIIMQYFKNNKDNFEDDEHKIVADYLHKYGFSSFPNELEKKYDKNDIIVYIDKNKKMKYVIHEEKKLYYPNFYSKYDVSRLYSSFLSEQDLYSPHRYESKNFYVKNGDIIADIGCTEGMWALSNIDKAYKIYLFESDKNWINALKNTFEPYKNKVFIVNKFVSNITEKNKIMLDDFFYENDVNIIKADIEGAEINMLEGSTKLLTKQNILFFLCTYHGENDAKIIKNILLENNFNIEFSDGFMFNISDEIKPPYLRKVIIRGKK